MEKTKRDFINELKETAQENIWKNELALEFSKLTEDSKDKEVKVKACEHAIVKDQEYIEFLNKQLDANSIQKTYSIPTTGTPF